MIAILAPLSTEIDPIASLATLESRIHIKTGLVQRGKIRNKEVVLARTGVGSRNMQNVASYIAREIKPDLFIVIGFGGGTSPLLHVGDIAIGNKVIDHNLKEIWECDASLSEEMEEAAKAAEIRFQKGPIVSVSKAVSDPHEKAFIGTEYDAIALDMEGSGVASVATEFKIPFVVVRAIFDTMETPLPNFSDDVLEDGEIRAVPLVKHFSSNPKDILKIPQFKFSADKSKESLQKIVQTWITQRITN